MKIDVKNVIRTCSRACKPTKKNVSENISIFSDSSVSAPKLTDKSFTPPAKKSLIKTLIKMSYEFYKKSKAGMKVCGVSNFDIIRCSKHYAPIMPCQAIFGEIKSNELLAIVPVKVRNSKKQINATLEKICFEDDNIVYLLKNKKKQLGYIDIEKQGNEVQINYMTNLLGRKKYRNIENILVQGMIEDMLKTGDISAIKATAADVANKMGRGYHNKSLYKRMGMIESEAGDKMIVTKDKIFEILKKRQEKSGKIIK